jgi:hypothetical protein
VIALKALRADLGQHLATGLGGANAAIGTKVNPPAVVVQSGATYVTALDYCSDHIEFDATIVAPPGDPAAVADALDDMIDKVRSQCATRSPAGRKYMFQGVGGYTTITSGDLEFPAVIATIGADRQVD